MQAETQHIQLAASNVVQQVLVGGRNLNQVLDETLRKKAAWLPSQRAALQDLSYGTLRFFGLLQAVLGGLLHKSLPDDRVRFLLLVALYQLQFGKSAPHAVVDHAVRATQTINPRAGIYCWG
jgi:16S rRNA (cytosine967-C5)-methyltransferase